MGSFLFGSAFLPIYYISFKIFSHKNIIYQSFVHKFIGPPYSLNLLSIHPLKHAIAMQCILMELPLIDLPIGQHEPAPALPQIGLEIAFVVHPVVPDFGEIGIIKHLSEFIWILMIEDSKPIEVIVDPVALISQPARVVVQLPLPSHHIIDPIPIIHPTVLIVEFTTPMAHAVELVALVQGALLEVFHDVLGWPLQVGSRRQDYGGLRHGGWRWRWRVGQRLARRRLRGDGFRVLLNCF